MMSASIHDSNFSLEFYIYNLSHSSYKRNHVINLQKYFRNNVYFRRNAFDLYVFIRLLSPRLASNLGFSVLHGFGIFYICIYNSILNVIFSFSVHCLFIDIDVYVKRK